MGWEGGTWSPNQVPPRTSVLRDQDCSSVEHLNRDSFHVCCVQSVFSGCNGTMYIILIYMYTYQLYIHPGGTYTNRIETYWLNCLSTVCVCLCVVSPVGTEGDLVLEPMSCAERVCEERGDGTAGALALPPLNTTCTTPHRVGQTIQNES